MKATPLLRKRLGPGNDRAIRRFCGHVVLQPQHFMFRRPQNVHNLI